MNNIMSPEQAEGIRLDIIKNPIEIQNKIFEYLINKGKNTKFGKDHHFSKIRSYQDYIKLVPVRAYNDFERYISLVLKGQENILWPEKPKFLFTSSGSTGQPKFIPGTEESVDIFYKSFIKTLMQYCYNNKLNLQHILNSKFINFTASTKLDNYCGYKTGPVSGILRLFQPPELAATALPSNDLLNTMNTQGWDKMFHLVAQESTDPKISSMVFGSFGLASWLAQFFNACCNILNTDNLTNVFPNYKLIFSSGVNYRPYLSQFQELFDHEIAIREAYAASEGFFAYQDGSDQDSMLLDVSSGIYYEFIPVDNLNNSNNINRLNLLEVAIDTPYKIIITNTAGLWSYEMGDIIQFTETNPFKIQIIGRTKHFLSIQSEHVYSQNVEYAIDKLNKSLKIDINNFTVAPNNINEKNLPYHIWYIETEQHHGLNLSNIALNLDNALRESNGSYNRSRSRNSLNLPKVVLVKPGGFLNYLSEKNSTSLQLKVPRVSNNRDIADYLINNNLIIDQVINA